MSRYRIVRVQSSTWKVQRKGWLFWRDEGLLMPMGAVAPHHFHSERHAEDYIDERIADEKAWKDPPREYPNATG